MERKCAICAGVVLVDKDNSQRAIQYKKKFYHCNCFTELCDQKIANKRASASWADVKLHIDDLVQETMVSQQNEIAKDEIYKFISRQYNISYVGSVTVCKLNSIYNGTFHGLAYPIEPVELFEEWKYYWDELCAIRCNKGIVGENAMNYDIAILLKKNAEYRRRKQSEQLAREIQRQQKEDVVVVDTNIIMKKTKKHKIADLYTEMTGGDGNE